MTRRLSHLDERGKARMVDVTAKTATLREATAEALLRVSPSTLALIRRGGVPKGDVAAVARLAGIFAAKRVPELIPLCHAIPVERCDVTVALEPPVGIRIVATVATTARTGVEMEALTAVAVGALAAYDMIKSVERGAQILRIRLLAKSGGRSGRWVRR